jgi:hypothetical protein
MALPVDTAGLKNAIKNTGSSANEKLHLVDLKFRLGEIIKIFDDPSNPKFVTKVGPNSYIDTLTHAPVDVREIASYLVSETKSKVCTYQEFEKSRNALAYWKKIQETKFTVDFETAFSEKNKTMLATEIFTGGFAEVTKTPAGTSRYTGRELFFTDVLEEMLNGNASERHHAKGALATSSKIVRTGYFNLIKRIGEYNNINFDSVHNLNEMLSTQRGKVKQVLELVNTKGYLEADLLDSEAAEIKKATAGMGATEYDLKSVLVGTKKASQYLGSTYGLGDANALLSRPISAFNPDPVDKPALATIYGDQELTKKLSIMDIRGHQLFINSALFPSLTDNAATMFAGVTADIANKLRLTDKQRQILNEKLKRGVSGVFSAGSSAEDMERILRYSLGLDSKLTHRPSAHGALADVSKEQQLLDLSSKFTNRIVKESANPEILGSSTRSRFISAYLMNQAIQAGIEGDVLYNKHTENWKGRMYDRLSRTVNSKYVEKRIESMIERQAGLKIEQNIIRDSIQQFGGGNVKQLLGGAMLTVGVAKAFNKAVELFMPSRENSTEGLNHNSLLTTISRLATTDFGSPRIAYMAPLVLKAASNLLKSAFSSRTATVNTIAQTLSSVNKVYKDIAKNENLFSTLTNEKKVMDMMTKIFGPTATTSSRQQIGVIQKGIDRALYRENISEGVHAGLTKIVKGAYNVAGAWHETLMKSKIDQEGAYKYITRRMNENMSKFFVTTGTNSTQFKAPAIALAGGAIGAIGIMTMRGTHNPNERNITLQEKQMDRMERESQRKNSISQQIQDLRLSADTEGIQIGSPERQYYRIKNTDFGSGLRTIGLTIPRGIKTMVEYNKYNIAKDKGTQALVKKGTTTRAYNANAPTVVGEKNKHRIVNDIKKKAIPEKTPTKKGQRIIDDLQHKVLKRRNQKTDIIPERLPPATKNIPIVPKNHVQPKTVGKNATTVMAKDPTKILGNTGYAPVNIRQRGIRKVHNTLHSVEDGIRDGDAIQLPITNLKGNLQNVRPNNVSSIKGNSTDLYKQKIEPSVKNINIPEDVDFGIKRPIHKQTLAVTGIKKDIGSIDIAELPNSIRKFGGDIPDMLPPSRTHVMTAYSNQISREILNKANIPGSRRVPYGALSIPRTGM